MFLDHPDQLPPSGTNGIFWRHMPCATAPICSRFPNLPGFILLGDTLILKDDCDVFQLAGWRLAGTVTAIRQQLNQAIREQGRAIIAQWKFNFRIQVVFSKEEPVGDDDTLSELVCYIGAQAIPDNLPGYQVGATNSVQLWQYEGRCPSCGELGRLDPCGGATCSKHGFYPLVIVPQPRDSQPVTSSDWLAI